MNLDIDLLAYNKRGLIPGPKETEEDFLKRAALQKAEGLHAYNALFDYQIDWVPIYHSQKNLRFWEGAATWSSDEKTFIQINPNFLTRLYSQEELVTHEMAHAARAAFDEPKYEEIFAYMTSNKKWRKKWGPLFQTPRESTVFLATCLLPLFLPYLFIVPLGFFIWGSLRLNKLQKKLRKTKQNLKAFCREEFIEPIVFRLTDREIMEFSSMSLDKIWDYIDAQCCLRWRMIKANYHFFLSEA